MRPPSGASQIDFAGRRASPARTGRKLWTLLGLRAVPLWVWSTVALAAVSIALISYPVEFRLQFTPIQSVEAIPELWLFSLLMIVWMALLVRLIFWATGSWSMAGLVTCFSLVYFSFWTLRWPDGSREDWLKMQGVQVIASTGHVEPDLMHYGDWPGIAILGATLSDLTGKEIASLVIPVVLVVQMTLPLCLFVLYWRLLGNTRAAALAVLAAIMANEYLARFHFHPFYFAPVLLVVALVILLRSMRQSHFHTSGSVLLLTLSGGIAILHAFTSVLLFTLLAGMFFLQQWRWARLPSIKVVPLIVMAVVMPPAMWQIYWSSHISDNLIIPIHLSNVIK